MGRFYFSHAGSNQADKCVLVLLLKRCFIGLDNLQIDYAK